MPERRGTVVALSSPTTLRRLVTFPSFVRSGRSSPSHLYIPTLFPVKSNVMWRPRGLGQPMNVSPVTSHGISGHKRAALPWRYTALRSPAVPRPHTLPSLPTFGLSFSRSRECVLAPANGETLSLCLPR